MTSRAADETSEAETALNRLIGRGYRFVHPRDADGEIVAVVGVRAHGDVIDVVRIEGEDEVLATRMPGDEEDILEPDTVLWHSEGAVTGVVDELLTLSDDEPAAQDSGTSGCWIAGEGGRARFLVAS